MIEKLFNDPIIEKFFANIAEQDKYSTLKQLTLLGINAINMNLRSGSHSVFQINNNRSNKDLIDEIQSMKVKIQHLAALVKQQKEQEISEGNNKENVGQEITFKPIFVKDEHGSNCNNPIHMNFQNQNDFSQHKKSLTPKVTETVPLLNPLQENNQNQMKVTSNLRSRSRHHLDDSQVRKALMNPFAKQTPQKQPKKDKVFLHQQQLDKQALKILKATQQQKEKEQILGRSKRSKTSHFASNNIKAESKIKMLVAKDRLKHKQGNNMADFHRYEYSSQQQIEDSHNINESINKTLPDNGNKRSRKSIKQISEESSSFNEPYERNNQQSYQKLTKQKKCMKNEKNKKYSNSHNESSESYSKFQHESGLQSEQPSKQKCFHYNEFQCEEDKISESSSFSKFSLGSQREIGKISRRKY